MQFHPLESLLHLLAELDRRRGHVPMNEGGLSYRLPLHAIEVHRARRHPWISWGLEARFATVSPPTASGSNSAQNVSSRPDQVSSMESGPGGIGPKRPRDWSSCLLLIRKE